MRSLDRTADAEPWPIARLHGSVDQLSTDVKPQSYMQQKIPWVKPGPHQILISWTPSSHSDRNNQSLRLDRLSTLIERPNDQLQYAVADQLDSLRPAVKAGIQARTQTRTQNVQCRATDAQPDAQPDAELDAESWYQTTSWTTKLSQSLCYFDQLPCRHRCYCHCSVQLFRLCCLDWLLRLYCSILLCRICAAARSAR